MNKHVKLDRYCCIPVSIKSVLKSVTNPIYTYPIDIQIHFPSTQENFQSNIFNFYFSTAICTPRRLHSPKKEEGKRGRRKKKRRNNKTHRPFQYFTIDLHFPLIFLSLSLTIVHTDQPANSKCTVISLSCTMAEQKSNKSRPNICST